MATATVAGAVNGGVGGKLLTKGVATVVRRVTEQTVLGSGVSSVQQVANNAIDGKPLSSGVAAAALGGGIGGGAGAKAGLQSGEKIFSVAAGNQAANRIATNISAGVQLGQRIVQPMVENKK
ncbi:hypothetical protein U1839_14925 [Sphingomonas sp. RT2P30]